MDKEVLEAFEQIVSRRVRIDGDCNPAYFTLEELQPSNVAKVRAHLSDPAFVRVPVDTVHKINELVSAGRKIGYPMITKTALKDVETLQRCLQSLPLVFCFNHDSPTITIDTACPLCSAILTASQGEG